jgi:hypothetical protein
MPDTTPRPPIRVQKPPHSPRKVVRAVDRSPGHLVWHTLVGEPVVPDPEKIGDDA